ncbi:MAG: PspC domain-containing protein [Bacteroidales bacterium]|nr:PspC domain-containing protein [Bacteroidales bacterium]MCL2738276.1 PspC domain-containing protein [Bacteroidales bacterium]
MKKVLNVGIGGLGFMIDEDAYYRLHDYLSRFKSGLNSGREASEVMSDVEQRIAELFKEELRCKEEVVSLTLVEKVIARLGFPEGTERSHEFNYDRGYETHIRPRRVLYRNPDQKMLGGICSGLAAYFDTDITLCRVLFLVALFFGTLGFWVYMILWIAVPPARTAAQKLEMRGIPVTAENLRRMTQTKFN